MITKTFGNPLTASTDANTAEDSMRGAKAIANGNGRAVSITVRINCDTASKLMKCALYDADTNGLIAQTIEQTIGTGGLQNVTFTFARKPRIRKNKAYYIVLWSQSATGAGSIIRTNVTGGTGVTMASVYGATFPNPIVPVANVTIAEIYCTYQLTGGGDLSFGNRQDRD